MSLVDIRRPAILPILNLDWVKQWNKRTTDNIDLINNSMVLVQFDATHGTEIGIKNPFGDRGAPIGFKVLDVTGNLGVASHTMRTARLTEDNRIGMTVQFTPPSHALRAHKASDQTGIASGTATAITWDGVNMVYGDSSLVAGGTGVFTFPDAGIVHAFATIGGTASGVAAGDSWGVFLDTGSAGNSRRLEGRIGVPTASRPVLNISGDFQVAAGDQLIFFLVQSNAAAATKDLESGDGLAGCQAGFHYVAPASDYTATVTGILYGPNASIVDVNG